MEIQKGMRVRARWLEPKPVGSTSLAGVQPKLSAIERTVDGDVVHIRGNSTSNPTSVGVWIKTDDGSEVVIDLRHITEVL